MESIKTKTIISNYIENNRWFGINYNMNIYKGCSHGCIYCDSRSQCYGIENFDKVRLKEDAISIITKELKKKTRKGVIGTGSMSDPYNPFERQLELTRKALEKINFFNFGISIVTKSSLITRDIDILKRIKQHSPTIIKITITTYDDELCSKIEPNVALTSERFEVIKTLSDNGIYVGVLVMPILPFINDNKDNIVNIVRKSHDCGAKFIYSSMGVTLRNNQRDYYYDSIMRRFPEKKLVKKYIETYKDKYQCLSPNSKELKNIFKEQCEKYGILYRMDDIISSYKHPYIKQQLSWF